MQGSIKTVSNPSVSKDYAEAALFGAKQAENVRKYHRSFAAYEPTKLKRMNCLADHLGIRSLFVKDESTRFRGQVRRGRGHYDHLRRFV